MPPLPADLQHEEPRPRHHCGPSHEAYEYVGGILRFEKSILLAAGGIPDHVHPLCSLSKELAVAEALRVIKANSSKWIHETFPQHRSFAWQAGYGAFAASFSHLTASGGLSPAKRSTIAGRPSQEEFVEFLRKHHVEFDERYLWD